LQVKLPIAGTYLNLIVIVIMNVETWSLMPF